MSQTSHLKRKKHHNKTKKQVLLNLQNKTQMKLKKKNKNKNKCNFRMYLANWMINNYH